MFVEDIGMFIHCSISNTPLVMDGSDDDEIFQQPDNEVTSENSNEDSGREISNFVKKKYTI